MSLKVRLYGEMGTGPSKQGGAEETVLASSSMVPGTEQLIKAEPQDDGLSTAGSGLLETLQNHIEDLRSLTTCKVCIKALYEPYTLSCGHTFCYSCLSQWFTTNRRKKTCPDCRANIVNQPAPAYLVKELTQVFISRSELLPSGETTDQHRTWQQEEARAVEYDKTNTHPVHNGLFHGAFKPGRLPHHPTNVHRIRAELFGRPAAPIRDVEDGVDRCPRCAWELEDGACSSCGYGHDEETNFYDISSESDIFGSDILDTDLDEEFDTEAEVEMERDLQHEFENDRENEMRQETLPGLQQHPGSDHGSVPRDYTTSPEPESHTAFSDIEIEDIDDEEPRVSDEESDDSGSLQDFIDDNINSSQSIATAHHDNPTSDEDASDSDSTPSLPVANTQRRARRVDDSNSESDSDPDSTSDGDTTVRQSPPSVGTQTLSFQAGELSRQNPVTFDESSSEDEDVRPTRRRRLNGGVMRLQNRARANPNDFQAPIVAMNDTVRALTNAYRPSRSSASRRRITRSSSRTPPSYSRNRLIRTQSSGLSRESILDSRPTVYGTSQYIPPFRAPSISRPPPIIAQDESSSSATNSSPANMRSVYFTSYHPFQRPALNEPTTSNDQPRQLQTRNPEAPGLHTFRLPALSFGTGTRSSPVNLSSPGTRN